MNQSDAHLFKLTSIIFDAALGNYYYQTISNLQGQVGTDSLAQSWGESDLAKSFLGTTPEAQARTLALNLGLDPDSEDASSADYIAYEFFLANLANGMNVGTLALAAIRYLEQDEILPVLETTRDYLNNRAEVAYQFSKELGMGEEDIGTLQAAISNVSSDEQAIPNTLRDIVKNAFDVIRETSPFTTYSDDDDVITGTEAADYINVGAGYDEVKSGGGSDIILGGTGDDELYGEEGQDFIEGGDGADTLYAGTYYNQEYVSGHYDEQNNYIEGYYLYTVDAYFEFLNGGSGADIIYGGYGSDTIEGGDGVDTIYGDGNSSNPFTYENFDRSFHSRLFNDVISGGEGDDKIYAGYGADTVYGGAGNDEIVLNNNQYYYYRSEKTDADGQNTAYGEDGDDTIYAVGSDNVDGGSGDDVIYFYRTVTSSEHGVIIAGEGSDNLVISHSDSSRSSSNITIDLIEADQVEDRVTIDLPARNTSITEIQNFAIDTDVLDLSEYVHIYSADDTNHGAVTAPQRSSYNDELTNNYVQIVDSTTTSWLEYSYEYPDNISPDDYGKAYFVIQGAHAASSSAADVAALIDNYGNNASYGKSDSHMFLVNVNDSDMGIYLFTDDTGANDRIVSDELTPVVVLTGITTEDITYNNVDFLV